MKRVLRAVFRKMPFSDTQRAQLMFALFRLTGNRFCNLPSYRLYLRHCNWQHAVIPVNLLAYRQEVLNEFYLPVTGPSMLMISHHQGGGTQKHLDDLSTQLEAEGWNIFYLQQQDATHLRLSTPQHHRGDPLFFRWPEEQSLLTETLNLLGISHIHLHHWVDLPADFPDYFSSLTQQPGKSFDITLHDYFSICPRFTLYDEAVRGYCGEPEDVRKCTACVRHLGSPLGRSIDVAQWRQRYNVLFSQARQIFVPDNDVLCRMQRYFPERIFTLRPHPETHFFTPVAAPRIAHSPLRVVIIGGIAPHKGSSILFDCAQDAQERNLPLEFHLIGYSDIDDRLQKLKTITISGHFNPDTLTKRLQAGKYNLAFLPSVIPETYNYALSECWRHGLYTACFDIGAIASRIRATQDMGVVFPLEWYFQPQCVNDALLGLEIPALTQAQLTNTLHRYSHLTTEYYQL